MAGKQTRIMYVEECAQCVHRGPAWIGRVSFSQSARTVYYRNFVLRRAVGGGIVGNHIDEATGVEFWVSGPKKNGEDRHWAGRGPIDIDEDVAEEYWTEIRGVEMPNNPYQID